MKFVKPIEADTTGSRPAFPSELGLALKTGLWLKGHSGDWCGCGRHIR